jgi:hypothetical protein
LGATAAGGPPEHGVAQQREMPLVFAEADRVHPRAARERHRRVRRHRADAPRVVLQVDFAPSVQERDHAAHVHALLGAAPPPVLGHAVDRDDRIVEGIDGLRLQDLEILRARHIHRDGGQVPQGADVMRRGGAAHAHARGHERFRRHAGDHAGPHLQTVTRHGKRHLQTVVFHARGPHHAGDLDALAVLHAGLQVLDAHTPGLGQRHPAEPAQFRRADDRREGPRVAHALHHDLFAGLRGAPVQIFHEDAAGRVLHEKLPVPVRLRSRDDARHTDRQALARLFGRERQHRGRVGQRRARTRGAERHGARAGGGQTQGGSEFSDAGGHGKDGRLVRAGAGRNRTHPRPRSTPVSVVPRARNTRKISRAGPTRKRDAAPPRGCYSPPLPSPLRASLVRQRRPGEHPHTSTP